MGSLERVVAVAVLAAGCGGASTKSPRNDTSVAGAPSGGATASGGVVNAGGTGTGGSASSGAPNVPQPIDLGDGDYAGQDGRPALPGGSTGGFFWRQCGNAGWRIGNWFVTSDGTRDAFPREIDPPRDGSTQARGVAGADLAEGAVLWVQLDHPSNGAVSLAGCSAMSFWARLDSPSGRVLVALNDGSGGTGSLGGRSSLPSMTLDVGLDWQEFVLPFESLGLMSDDLSIASIEFFVGEGGESFDLWIDDLALICSAGCP